MKRKALLAVMVSAALSVGMSSFVMAAETDKEVAAWGNYCSNVDFMGAIELSNQTVRSVIELNITGNGVSIQLSNKWGEEELVLDHVTFAKVVDEETGEIDPSTVTEVLFDGETQAHIPAGESLTSDFAEADVQAGGLYAVSYYIAGSASITTGNIFNASTYAAASETGDQTEEAVIESEPQMLNMLLETVNVYTEDTDAKAFVIVGDSTSSNGWPALLQDRLDEEGIEDTSVICRSVIGNRLMVSGFMNVFGDSVLDRWDECVTDTEGVEAVFLKIGVNDLFHPVSHPEVESFTVEEMIEAEEGLIEKAHEQGIKVYMATITPFNGYDEGDGNLWNEDLEAMRLEWNEWIMTNDLIDGYVDLCELMEDPSDTTSLLEEYTQDHLHPSDLGLQVIADSLPLEWFE